MITVTSEIRVEFYDVDALKVVWHGHYARYFETARNALFERLGFGYPEMERSGYAWPVVDLRVRYLRPARLYQRLRVAATLAEYENRVRMEFLITDADTGEKLTRGESVQVAVDAATGELQFVCPEVFAARVRKALA